MKKVNNNELEFKDGLDDVYVAGGKKQFPKRESASARRPGEALKFNFAESSGKKSRYNFQTDNRFTGRYERCTGRR